MAAVPRPHAKRSDAECAAARVRRRARAAGPDRASEAGRVEWDLDKSAVQERVFDAHSASRAAIAAWFVADGPPDRAGEGPRGGRLVALPAPDVAPVVWAERACRARRWKGSGLRVRTERLVSVQVARAPVESAWTGSVGARC